MLIDSKYLTSDAYLLEGDVLLNDSYHTATNLTTGAKATEATTTASNGVKVDVKVDAAQSKDKNLAGTYTVTASALNLRAGAGTGKTILAEIVRNCRKITCADSVG